MTDSYSLQVHPAELDRIAGAADDLAAAVRDEMGVVGRAADGARAVRGWNTGAVLEEVSDSWEEELRRLARHLGRLRDAFEQCAVEYREGDQVSADAFRSLDR